MFVASKLSITAAAAAAADTSPSPHTTHTHTHTHFRASTAPGPATHPSCDFQALLHRGRPSSSSSSSWRRLLFRLLVCCWRVRLWPLACTSNNTSVVFTWRFRGALVRVCRAHHANQSYATTQALVQLTSQGGTHWCARVVQSSKLCVFARMSCVLQETR